VPSRASLGDAPRTRIRAASTCGWTAGFVLAFYLVLYPIHGYRVPIGSDTPVYVWWARYAGVSGIGGLGTRGRSAIVALLASLSRLTGLPVAAVAEAIAPVLAAALALAAGALVHATVGRDRPRFVLTVALTGGFLSLMVPGYLSTLAFGALFVAALAALAEGLEGSGLAPVAGAAALIGAAGLAHLLFLTLAAAVLATVAVALGPSARRSAEPFASTGFGRVVMASAGGAALAVAGFLAIGGGPPAPDTSRDAVLRKAGLGRLLGASYRRKLHHDFPWFRTATALVLAATPLATVRRGRTLRTRLAATDQRRLLFLGAMTAWLAVSVGTVVALLLHFDAPGQRLAAFCIPLPLLAAVGLAGLRERGEPRRGRAASVAGGVLFLVVAWLAWGGQHPLVSAGAVSQAQAAGAALALQPRGTPLILVADDRHDKPSLFLTRYANYLRDAVPGARVPDAHLFVGTPADLLAGHPGLTGQPEHDALARESWAEVRPLLARKPLAIVVQAFDPAAFRQATAMGGGRGGLIIAPGVVAVGGYRGAGCCPPQGSAYTDPGAGPLSPWEPVWLGPALLLLLWAVGLRWSRVTLSGSGLLVRLALAPAMGVAALSLASIAVDAAGLRLARAGGWVALAIALMAPWLSVSPGRFRRSQRAAPPGDRARRPPGRARRSPP
jgi:hypothetical protein